MNNVLGVIGLAVVDTGFCKALFKAGKTNSASADLMQLLVSFGFSPTYDELLRVKHLTRELDKVTHKTKVDKAKDKVKGRLNCTDQEASDLVEKLLFSSPGSLEGLFGFANDVFCPIWPCDPTEP